MQTSDSIALTRLFVLKGALSLEVLGLKRKGRSAFSIVKEEFGFLGDKKQVLEKLTQYIKNLQEGEEANDPA